MNRNLCLGKKAPRLDKRTLRLARYLKPAALQNPPPGASWVTDVPSWPMDLNDELGDCVVAAMAHMVQQWTFYVNEKRSSGTTVVIPESAVLSGYEAIGGYVPNNPDTDNGCDMLTALKYWRRVGLGGHRILAFVQVDPKNKAEWQNAIALFGNVFAGFALPTTAQGQDAWTVPDGGAYGDGSPGGWGGHCVPLMAYSDKTITCVTWGQTLKMSYNFLADYCDEAFAVLSPDWFDNKKIAPSQLDYDQLKLDLAAL